MIISKIIYEYLQEPDSMTFPLYGSKIALIIESQ